MKTTKEMIEVMEWFEGGGAIECANYWDTDRVIDTSNMHMIKNIVTIKLLDT